MLNGSVAGLDGTLISPRAAAEWLQAHNGATPSAAAAIAAWAAAAVTVCGPATSKQRALASLENLFATLGYDCRRDGSYAVAISPSDETIALFGFDWQRAMTLSSREVLRAAIDNGADWACGFNGSSLALLDARAARPRRMAVISLDHLASHSVTASFAAALLDPAAFARGAIADAIHASDCSSLELKNGVREGVHESLAALRRELPFDASIAVLFRMLFVLFAEARALVPVWHRIYREHYSLAGLAARRLPEESRGVWAALEAGRRMLGAGCAAGTLRVTGFNGRLFEPAAIRKWPASAALDSRLDRPAAEALASLLNYRPSLGGARRVNYAELDVEELGSIYERVLDLDPDAEGRARKESGSFYTPRSLTAFTVRRTLAPLIEGASSARILELRVVDPAMGSGAFLIAALHFLAGALERAMIDEGRLPDGDVTSADRQMLRRLVAQRCLYGVDASPTATMLAKLSLWLATLSGDKPLGFLDHRLKCGNSLTGVDPLRTRHTPGRKERHAPLPLFDAADCDAAVVQGAARAVRLSTMTEDTLSDVRRKQKFFAALDGGGLEKWRVLCDTWCAWWFMPAQARPDAREYAALADTVLGGARVLSTRHVQRRLRAVAAIRSAHRLFHWPLEFPEVFAGPNPGFDAVIGNPPWEMLRAGSGSSGREPLKQFARSSGLYTLSTSGHVNLYQLFVERALQLARSGGRIGMILPWGLMSDEGSTALRRHLLDGSRIDTLVRFENTEGLFQAHRSLRFAALTTSAGLAPGPFELTRAERGARGLDDLPDIGPLRCGPTVTREALGALGGRSRRIPDVRDERSFALALKLARSHRSLGDPDGWGASFGRELNLTEDRAAFGSTGMPVLEGKHLRQGGIDIASGCFRITRAAAARALPGRPYARARLAYRDVTSPTNHHTVIAAIVPAGMVTSHTLFCLRNEFEAAAQRALCRIMNSAVSNFLIRLFVSSHLTTALMEWLPVPERKRAVHVLADPGLGIEEVESRVAELYGLTQDERAAI